jgi:hypothetical protein
MGGFDSNAGSDLFSQGGESPSTIGAGGLDDRVRNGNGYDPSAIATDKLTTDGRSVTSLRHTSARAQSTSMRPARVSKIIGQASRLISTARLNPSLGLHLQPINVLVSNEPLGRFTLREI